jgi:uncharacterized protein YegP (UPF0339 family)
MTNRIVEYKDAKDEWRWRVESLNGDTLSDSGEGYKNRKDMLSGLFSVYFAEYDDSFLALYNEWNPPEAQDNAGIQTPEHIANDDPPPVKAQDGTDASVDWDKMGTPKPDGLTDSSV